MASSKVILDTNLWISFLISGKFDLIDKLLLRERIILIFSDELIEEFITVISRPKFKKYFSKNDVDRILRMFDSYGKLIATSSKTTICRDIKDNFLLDLAIDSNADFLLTGDEDLLILQKIGHTQILSFSSFIKLPDFS